MTLLADIGEALWGPRWQSELARALQVNIRTAQRWAAGEIEPPAGVYGELLKIAEARRDAMGDLIRKLKAAAP